MKFFHLNLLAKTLIPVFFLAACERNDDRDLIDNKGSKACFEISEGDLYAEMPINFDASCSDPAAYYIWDFGDDNAGTGAKLNHTFDAAGKYTVILAVGNHQDSLKTIEKTITILPSPFIKHSGYIYTDEIWEEGMHLLTGKVIVRNGSLTIKPGAEIYFPQYKSLVIGDESGKKGAMFIAEGTSEKPILFMPADKTENPGAWGVILFRPQASDSCSMEYCHIRHGGQIGSTDFWLDDDRSAFGTIYIEETHLNFQHCSVTGSKSYGIRLTENAGFTGFANNTFSGNLSNPVYIGVDHVHTLNEPNTMAGEKGIRVHSTWFQQEDASWHKQDVPYIIENEVRFTTLGKRLNIMAGVEIQFADKQAAIDIGSGNLRAIGTATEPVLFTSGQPTKARGDWMGIYAQGKLEFEYCTIEYAGAPTYNNHKYSIRTGSNAVVSMNNCTIRETAGIAIDMEGCKNLLAFNNNTIDGADNWGLTLHAQAVTNMDVKNTILNTKGFLISGSIDSTTRWIKRDIPYIIDYEVSVNGESASLPVLTIDPGVQIRLATGSSLRIIHGELQARGTQENPISFDLFEGSILAQTGNWNQILFGFEYDWHANTGNSAMTWCIIRNGGNSSNSYPENGAIYCWNSVNSPLIENCTISSSETYGIVSNKSTPKIISCSYSANKKGETISF